MVSQAVWENAEFWAKIDDLRPQDDDGLFDCSDAPLVVHPRTVKVAQCDVVTVCTKRFATEILLELPVAVTGPVWLAPALLGPERGTLFCLNLQKCGHRLINFVGDPDPIDLVCFWNIMRLVGDACPVRWIDAAASYGESTLNSVSLRWAGVERAIDSVVQCYSHDSPLAVVHRELWRNQRKVELEGVLRLSSSHDRLLDAIRAP